MHAHNDDWGITTVVIDLNAYDREMKTHLHGDQGENYKIWLILCTMVGYSAECFSRTIVHVECKCLIGSGSAEHCHPHAALLILLGVRYNRGARAVHLIGGEVISGLPKRTLHMISCYTWCAMRGAMGGVVSWWLENKKIQMAIECVRMMGKNISLAKKCIIMKAQKIKREVD